MATLLQDMEIEEISLVDDGANPGARVEIWKSKAAGSGHVTGDPVDHQQEIMMTLEELSAALEQAEARMDTLEKAKTDAEAKVAELDTVVKGKDARIAELEGTIAKGRTPADADEAFLKALPEAAREAVVKARADAAEAKAALAKARDAGDTEAAIAKAKGLGFGKAEDVGPLLMRVAKGKTTEADASALEQLLKSAGTMAAQSPLFRMAGSSAAVDGDPEELLKAKAAEIQKAKPKLTPEQAYTEALDANPDLYLASIAKRRAVAA